MRERPNAREIAASFALALVRPNDKGELVPVIDREWARDKTAAEILRQFEIDHDPVPRALAKALGWSVEKMHHPSNLTPLLKPEHREKTAKRDIPEIAKGKRITKAQEESRRRMLAKDGIETEPVPQRSTQRIPSRPMRGGRRLGGPKLAHQDKLRCMEALRLRDVERFSYDEIAAHMGLATAHAALNLALYAEAKVKRDANKAKRGPRTQERRAP